MAITSAFQADDEGSIPSTRSNDFHFLNQLRRHLRCQKVVVGEGFEPSKSVTADLQSAPFGRSGTPPDLMVPTTGIELVTY